MSEYYYERKIIIAKLSPSSSFSYTGLALLPLFYHQPASQPPGIVSTLTSNINQSIPIRLTNLKMQDNLNCVVNVGSLMDLTKQPPPGNLLLVRGYIYLGLLDIDNISFIQDCHTGYNRLVGAM
jgi:hypothetical protein